MDEANAFDKRNSSNAEIVLSANDSDMIVDLNSVKDEKEIPEPAEESLLFQESADIVEKRVLRTKKITPEEMLEQMD